MINVFAADTDEQEFWSLYEPIVKTHWLGPGKIVENFESAISNRLGLPGMCMVDSGSHALLLVIKLLDLPAGSDIIVPSFTWVACANAVLLSGHNVVFCDVDTETGNATHKTIKDALTANTRAIMLVDYAGLIPHDIDEIKKIGLPIIEDAAHSINSKLNGISAGLFGDVAIYSFDSVKNLATPEGGGITSPDIKLIERAKELRYCGVKSGFGQKGKDRWWECDQKEIWYKTSPNDISAAIGLVQLRKLDNMQARRKEIWDRYQVELKNTPPNVPVNAIHSYFTYLIRSNKRDELAKKLLDNGIYSTLRYHPLHMNKIYKFDKYLPNCEYLAEHGLNLPLHSRLGNEEVEKIIHLSISI